MKTRPVRPIHLCVLFVTLIALLAYSFTPAAYIAYARPATLTNPCAYDPNNLFTNGMMLPGWSSPYGTIANGWTPFIFSGNAPQFNVVNNEGIDDTISQQIYEVNTFDAGIQQTVNNLQIGTNYWMRWGYSLAAKSYGGGNVRVNTIGRQFGVIPYGGTDPHDARVIWGPILWDGNAALNRPEMTIVFTARATSATMFLRAIASQNDGGENRVWIDALCMEARPDLTPSPSPPPLTSPTPSTNFLPLVQVSPSEAGCVAPSVLTNIAVGAQPKGITTDPGTNRAFVSLFGGSSVAVVNAATNQVTATWGTGTAGHANGIGFANNRLFVALRDTNSVAILDASGSVLANKAVGSQPWGLGAANNAVWVANFNSNSVSTLDATTNNVVKTLGTGVSPSMVAPAGSHAFVALMSGGIVDVDGAGNQLNNWGWDAGAFGVAFNASANRLYVASRDTNKLAILNASTGANVTSITLANTPYALAYNANTNHLYVVLAEVNQVNIRDGTSLADLGTLALGTQSLDGGDGIAVMNNRVYISNYSAGTVTVIRDACP
ncbi:MAG: YncE family protein [Chloroflexi bacterium]|nr:YncE family protein [Chloroflexota bacterium]